jgi:hypothetical protein
MQETPTAYSMQFQWGTPTTTKVPEIIAKMEAIARDLIRSGAANLGLSLNKQIDELKEILGVRE